MHALDRDYQPMFMPSANSRMLMQYGGGCADIDARIASWFATARALAMAYRQSLTPQTERFKRDLAEFDRCHTETLEPRRSLIWRLPALSIGINRLLCDGTSEKAVLWRCYALHLADFEELKASGFPYLPVQEEFPYALMVATFLKAATRGMP